MLRLSSIFLQRFPRFALASAGVVLSFSWASCRSDPSESQAMKESENWKAFKDGFIAPSGRVIDNVNHAMSHSEGQGYAMLLAVSERDRTTFDRVWGWTQTALQSRPSDALISWKWELGENGSGKITDANNATDGDILVAWALVRANVVWGEVSYLDEARKICSSIRETVVRDSPYGKVILPGAEGFENDDGIVLNLSYWVFPAFLDLNLSDPEFGLWSQLYESGQRLLSEAAFGEYELPSDWVALNGEALSPAPDFEPAFGYNAIRIPLYLKWSEGEGAQDYLARYSRLQEEWESVPARISVSNEVIDSEPAPIGMQEVLSYASADLNSPIEFLDRPMDPDSGYYSSVLQLLTRLAVLEQA
ncbi:MAG: glycosyl hydrolase family 8 [Verrucomicrobiota bacterium]